MKYKAGDKVRIKSIDWYNKNKDEDGDVPCNCNILFLAENKKYLGTTQTVERVYICEGQYVGNYIYKLKGIENTDWTDEMIKGLVEEETKPKFKVGDEITNGKATLTILNLLSEKYVVKDNFGQCGILYFNSQDEWKIVEEETKPKYEDEVNGEYYSTPKYLVRPSGYQFKDENGNVINAQKIVLEKKHNDKLKLESTKKVREYWNEYTRIFIEIYDDKSNECVLTHLYTLESHRQKGYGRQALIEAESIAKELGCHTAYLKVETDSWMYEWYLRMGYKWYRTADEGYTWLAKNLTGMEKKKEYPKTLEECCEVLDTGGYQIDYFVKPGEVYEYEKALITKISALYNLIICRDAYWKLYGDEMGLGKPWEPDWTNEEWPDMAYISYDGKSIDKENGFPCCNMILIFPYEEMRDAFYENFKELIEICKELL